MKKLNILFAITFGIFMAGMASASIGEYWSTVSHIIPRTDVTVDIGSATKKVREIWTNKFYGDYWISATNNSMNVQPTGDTDDFFSFKTPADRPTIKREGGKYIYVESSNVNDVGISFRKDADHSGTVNYYKDENLFGLTSKDPLVFKVCADYDDYVKICAASNVPEMSTVGAADFKINAGGANALLLNHAGGNVAVGATSTGYILGLGTGDTFGIGTTQWNSADEIDGTKIKDADYGDVVIDAAGDWQVSEATALSANGANCGAGQSPLGVDASGAVESCFDVWTEAENTAAGYISATLTEEQVEDFTGGMLGGTETHIAVTYQDITNDIDFVVSDDWWNADGDIAIDTISESKIAFSTACGAGNHYYLNGNDLACEANTTNTDTQDLSYNTGTDVISLVDGGSIDITEVDTDTNLTQEEVDDFVNLLLKDADSVNTRITLTYDDVNNAFDFVVDDMNDDVPDAGDFGAATDLDANGALNTGSVSDNEIDYATVNMDDMTNGSTNAAITLTQETNFETAYTHSQDNTQAHTDYFLNSGSDIAGGGAGFTWTFNASAGTDSVFTFGNGIVNLTTGALQVGGSAVLTGNESITLSGDVTGSGATAITTTIGADKILESMLKAVNSPTDEYVLTYEATTGDFEWEVDQTGAGGSAITFDIGDDGGNDSVDVNEIATTGDTNTIFTESTADKILIAVGNNWPTADTATTASALVANPTDCGANQFAQSIVANGNLTCSAIGDADVPNNITIDLATLASSVTNATFTTALTVNTGTITLTGNVANNSVLTIGAGAVSVSGANTGDQDLSGYWDADGDIAADEISESKINFSTACGAGNHYYLNGNDLACEADDDTTYTAGRSLTLTTTTFAADSELYHHEKCFYIEDPVAEDDLKSLFHFRKAATITGMWCESDQTVNMDLQLDDGTPADINGTDLVCDSTPADDTSMGGDTGAAAGERLDLAITSVSGTPTWVSICFDFTYDD